MKFRYYLVETRKAGKFYEHLLISYCLSAAREKGSFHQKMKLQRPKVFRDTQRTSEIWSLKLLDHRVPCFRHTPCQACPMLHTEVSPVSTQGQEHPWSCREMWATLICLSSHPDANLESLLKKTKYPTSVTSRDTSAFKRVPKASRTS